ncbi:DUF2147 domain-containing protein [Aquabacterium sp. J223]|uniref:DUF2147 domain-containing protein n=1 Tax=Aquabacterium sp. J223 TaxID=2898431 RepID=UPI0021ADE1F1|nr:DUF2147 domain-containing protein [Aquabacterium sp. J223]UUX96732.1 DUF2147 domain-containing protein [Aquabacterium sp. J223]
MRALSLLLAAVAWLGAGAAAAQTTPVGLWKTIDDASGKEKALVRVSEAGGVLSARIERLFNPSTPNPVCGNCADDRKGQPVTGLQIVRGVRQDAGDAMAWSGGEILDPENGRTYRVRLKPIDGGQRLEVRGYIGTPMLGRTQTWQRVE